MDNVVKALFKISGDTQTHHHKHFITLQCIVSKPLWLHLFLHCDPSVTHKDLFTAHFTFHLRAGNISQTATLALFAANAEAKGQEIIAIKTTLAKVSQIREIKLVTLKKSRDLVTDVVSRIGGRDPRKLCMMECICSAECVCVCVVFVFTC